MARYALILALQIGLTYSVVGARHGHSSGDRRRAERRQSSTSTAAALLDRICNAPISGQTSADPASCRNALEPQIDASRQQYCSITCEEADECTSEQGDNGSLVCSNLHHWCDICDDTVYDQYALCSKTGLQSTELATCVNDRLNLDPAVQSSPMVPITTSILSNLTVPMVVTTAIPFWTNGSIAYLSTTATLPPPAGLITAPAPLITASGLRTGALPAPPAFSPTGFWTNTTGSFASSTFSAISQGNRNGTYFTSTSQILGTAPMHTAVSSSSPASTGDPNASQLGPSGSATGGEQSTTGARLSGAYTSEGQLCSEHTTVIQVSRRLLDS